MGSLLAAALTFFGAGVLVAFLSPFVVRVIVRIYPADSPRRDEFVAELEEVPVPRRVTWLVGVLATAIIESTPDRLQFAVRDFWLVRRTANNFVTTPREEIERQTDGAMAAAGGLGFMFVLAGALALPNYGTVGATLVASGLLVIASPLFAFIRPTVIAAWRWCRSLVRALRNLRADRQALVRDLLDTIE